MNFQKNCHKVHLHGHLAYLLAIGNLANLSMSKTSYIGKNILWINCVLATYKLKCVLNCVTKMCIKLCN